MSIAYSRKAYGIMCDIFGDDIGGALTIKAQEMTAENLIKAYELSVSNPPDTKVISKIKLLSKKNFKMLEGVINEKILLKNSPLMIMIWTPFCRWSLVKLDPIIQKSL